MAYISGTSSMNISYAWLEPDQSNSVERSMGLVEENFTSVKPFAGNDTDDPRSLVDIPIVRATLILLYALVFLLCFFGNLMLLAVVAAHPAMRTVTNFFLANLAAADLLVAVFCVMQRIAHQHMFEQGHWPFGLFFCRMYLYLLQMVPSTSAGLLLVLSLERYVALLKPMLARRLLTKGRLAIVAGLTWLASACANLPFFMSGIVYSFGSYSSCTRDKSSMDIPLLLLMNFLMWYVAPLCIMTILYTLIGTLLWRSVAEGSVAKTSFRSIRMTNMAPTAQESQQHNNAAFRDSKKTSNSDNHNRRLLEIASNESATSAAQKERVDGRRRVIRLLIAIIVSFALLCLPHHVRQLWTNWSKSYSHDIYGVQALFPDFAFLLLFMNSAVNPLLYALMSKKFRQAIKEIFSRKHIRDAKREQFVSSMRSTLTSPDAFSTTDG